ncbi:hypothetical protein E2C01_024555 [Portunus trituberculatus]|uniref:Uncharacterized protein n=1 Tax=Portunus trituberculatus TaxID=210409 RepID=A0A5B7EAL7_PORTR|nr:hypothetical protein [Portunus trituberculatus]
MCPSTEAVDSVSSLQAFISVPSLLFPGPPSCLISILHLHHSSSCFLITYSPLIPRSLLFLVQPGHAPPPQGLEIKTRPPPPPPPPAFLAAMWRNRHLAFSVATKRTKMPRIHNIPR